MPVTQRFLRAKDSLVDNHHRERERAVEIIVLPPVLPGELDLEALNRQLRSGIAMLDWSNVQAATPAQLHTLLAGLDLVEHNEVLGIATVPNALAEKVSQVLMPALLSVPSPAHLREELQAMVIRDLLGSAGGADEELTEDRVHDRYLVGMLAPEKVQTVPEEQDELGIAEEGAGEEGPADVDASQVTSLSPSSFGMSFCVDKEATTLRVTARWGHYQRQESEVIKTTKKGDPKLVWRRSQRESTKEITLKEGSIPPWRPAIDE